jgi:hypothetical protein
LSQVFKSSRFLQLYFTVRLAACRQRPAAWRSGEPKTFGVMFFISISVSAEWQTPFRQTA